MHACWFSSATPTSNRDLSSRPTRARRSRTRAARRGSSVRWARRSGRRSRGDRPPARCASDERSGREQGNDPHRDRAGLRARRHGARAELLANARSSSRAGTRRTGTRALASGRSERSALPRCGCLGVGDQMPHLEQNQDRRVIRGADDGSFSFRCDGTRVFAATSARLELATFCVGSDDLAPPRRGSSPYRRRP